MFEFLDFCIHGEPIYKVIQLKNLEKFIEPKKCEAHKECQELEECGEFEELNLDTEIIQRWLRQSSRHCGCRG